MTQAPPLPSGRSDPGEPKDVVGSAKGGLRGPDPGSSLRAEGGGEVGLASYVSPAPPPGRPSRGLWCSDRGSDHTTYFAACGYVAEPAEVVSSLDLSVCVLVRKELGGEGRRRREEEEEEVGTRARRRQRRRTDGGGAERRRRGPAGATRGAHPAPASVRSSERATRLQLRRLRPPRRAWPRCREPRPR